MTRLKPHFPRPFWIIPAPYNRTKIVYRNVRKQDVPTPHNHSVDSSVSADIDAVSTADSYSSDCSEDDYSWDYNGSNLEETGYWNTNHHSDWRSELDTSQTRCCLLSK